MLKSVVSQFNIIRANLIDNETTPLQVGNGNFAYNVDTTGMQSYLPFNTLSNWVWHNDSFPENGTAIMVTKARSELPSDYKGVSRETYGREVYYDIPDLKLKQATQWLISNPNRVNLGRIGLLYQGSTLNESLITDSKQELDLWYGTITSTFKVDGESVRVVTQGDFESDAVAFTVTSKLIRSGDLQVEMDFPYPPIHSTKYKYEVFVGVYDFPLNHTTTVVEDGTNRTSAHIRHGMQEVQYFANLRWPEEVPLKLTRNEPPNSTAVTAHRYTLSTALTSSSMVFTAHFSPSQHIPCSPAEIMKNNIQGWNEYWEDGGFVDLTASSNPNATELQRRIIQSQYHVRVNSAAKGQSPQESGLMNNGWYGKFHMEMVIWHNAHWATWGKQKYFNNIFPELYETLLPSSLARAQYMGWEGARWPKMTDPETGTNSPGDVNAQLIWQQPHAFYLANLAYMANPTMETLQKWDKILTATADYMASYPGLNATTGKYDLGPPTYGVTENTPPNSTRNLAYELAYWRYGLDAAAGWKRRLGQPVPEKWMYVAQYLALPPQIDGLYTVYDGLNSSWWDDPKLNSDPRSLIMMQGILPSTPAVDPEVALRTADKVWAVWGDEKIRGWGRPVLAINSARIGNPERAIYHLTAFDTWKFDDAGFAIRGGDGGTPPPFLPGSAGFLYAVAYCVAGWQGAESETPGFPKDGSWIVKQEGLMKAFIIDTGLTSPAPTLLLLHGISSSSKLFSHILDSTALNTKYRIVTFCLPGHGASSKAPSSEKTYWPRGYADLAVHILQHLRITQVVVLGWDLGGHVGIEMVDLTKQVGIEMKGLMLVGAPPALGKEQVSKAFKFEDGGLGLSGQKNWSDEQADLFARNSAAAGREECFEPFMLEDAKMTDSRARMFMAQSFLGTGDTGAVGVDQRSVVEETDVPVAVVNGAEDQFVNLDYLDEISWKRLWKGKCIRLEGLGHAPFWEDPGMFEGLLVEFMADCCCEKV
ncbi:Six-hairpin glycosidase [Pyrenophora seminiperda CCB06]|uniref:Six-hairpin glycosidase n=1 Tax=Pyrenophora seminiperda CCB06 TaxID=1302712 RepID=A0A3M7MJD2_9PLEO|nr:Six-hairpin glycosidase [Pyrenophora seminiperda CCB06]